MSSDPTSFPVSLQSWPSKPQDGGVALQTLIQRVNAERGGFANISEESLRQEIAEAEAQGADEAETSDEEAEPEPDRPKELQAAREDMLRQLDTAEQASMFALDFISLLLSKDTPVQASLTISPILRDMVGMGTLGADKLHAPRITPGQKEDNKCIAEGWKSLSLESTVDSILASATRLEREIELETRYWEQVLAVSEKGWAVCRLPQAKHILGVRFGFSEASPVFKNQSLAALKRNPDGSISLDQGRTTSEPQTLRVRIQKNGKITGSSRIPHAASANASVEALILQARNTIFAAELWQEMNRESRSLGPLGVISQGDTLIFPLSVSKKVILDLVSINEFSTPMPEPDDSTAECISISLQLLLSYAHRQAHRRRTAPPLPISSAKRPNPPCNLIRPIITLLTHQNTITTLHQILRPLIKALSKTSPRSEATYSIAQSTPTMPANLSTPERTVASLTERLSHTLTLTITPRTTLTINIRTAMMPLTSSIFYLSLNPSSMLNTTLPPPPTLTSFETVKNYIYFCVCCALAAEFTTRPSPQSPGSSNADGTKSFSESNQNEKEIPWEMTAHPSTLRLLSPDFMIEKNLTFSIYPLPLPSYNVSSNVFSPPPSNHYSDAPTSTSVAPISNLKSATNRKGIKLRLTWKFISADISGMDFDAPSFDNVFDDDDDESNANNPPKPLDDEHLISSTNTPSSTPQISTSAFENLFPNDGKNKVSGALTDALKLQKRTLSAGSTNITSRNISGGRNIRVSGSGGGGGAGSSGLGKRRPGEGFYEWVAWEDECFLPGVESADGVKREDWAYGEGEVYLKIGDVVRDAGREMGGVEK